MLPLHASNTGPTRAQALPPLHKLLLDPKKLFPVLSKEIMAAAGLLVHRDGSKKRKKKRKQKVDMRKTDAPGNLRPMPDLNIGMSTCHIKQNYSMMHAPTEASLPRATLEILEKERKLLRGIGRRLQVAGAMLRLSCEQLKKICLTIPRRHIAVRIQVIVALFSRLVHKPAALHGTFVLIAYIRSTRTTCTMW